MAGYRFYVDRPHPSKRGFFRGEWLPGAVDRDNIVEEAWALLEDPRDDIVAVKVWSERWQHFLPLTFAPGWSQDGTRKER